MENARWSNFFGSGAMLLPPLLGFGNGSMIVFAVAQLIMLLLFLLVAAWEQNAREAAGTERDRDD